MRALTVPEKQQAFNTEKAERHDGPRSNFAVVHVALRRSRCCQEQSMTGLRLRGPAWLGYSRVAGLLRCERHYPHKMNGRLYRQRIASWRGRSHTLCLSPQRLTATGRGHTAVTAETKTCDGATRPESRHDGQDGFFPLLGPPPERHRRRGRRRHARRAEPGRGPGRRSRRNGATRRTWW